MNDKLLRQRAAEFAALMSKVDNQSKRVKELAAQVKQSKAKQS